MNRRQQLACFPATPVPTYQALLDIFGDDIGRSIVALLDVVAAHEDERDDIIGGALPIEMVEPGNVEPPLSTIRAQCAHAAFHKPHYWRTSGGTHETTPAPAVFCLGRDDEEAES